MLVGGHGKSRPADGKANSAMVLRHDLAIVWQKLHAGILYAPAVPLPAIQSAQESIWNALMHGRKILVHKEFFKTWGSVSVVITRGQTVKKVKKKKKASLILVI